MHPCVQWMQKLCRTGPSIKNGVLMVGDTRRRSYLSSSMPGPDAINVAFQSTSSKTSICGQSARSIVSDSLSKVSNERVASAMAASTSGSVVTGWSSALRASMPKAMQGAMRYTSMSAPSMLLQQAGISRMAAVCATASRSLLASPGSSLALGTSQCQHPVFSQMVQVRFVSVGYCAPQWALVLYHTLHTCECFHATCHACHVRIKAGTCRNAHTLRIRGAQHQHTHNAVSRTFFTYALCITCSAAPSTMPSTHHAMQCDTIPLQQSTAETHTRCHPSPCSS